jgi:ribonuclease HI
VDPRILRLHTDGASRGNPGAAAIGVVIADPQSGAVLEEIARPIGRTTNNVAEYEALLAGLRRALELGAEGVEVWSDSELLVRQMEGRYQVRNAALQGLHAQARTLGGRFPQGLRMHHTLRGGNARADELANEALDGRPRAAAPSDPALFEARALAPAGGGGAAVGPGLRLVRLAAGQTGEAPWGLVVEGRVEVGGSAVPAGHGWRERRSYRAGVGGALVLEAGAP